MAHSGYARIITSELQIWIRFERIGRSGKFDLLLDAFRHAFPLAKWDEYHKAWMLPAGQLDQVIRFCKNVLGEGKVQMCPYNTTVFASRQFPLL